MGFYEQVDLEIRNNYIRKEYLKPNIDPIARLC